MRNNVYYSQILYRFLNCNSIVIQNSVLFNPNQNICSFLRVFRMNAQINGGLFVNMYEKIQELCDEKDIKFAQLCREIGIPKSTLSELKQGRTKTLSTQNLIKVAQYFGVSLDYFDDSVDELDIRKDELFQKRKLLFDMSKKATEDQLDTFIVMFKALIDQEEK